MVVDGANGIFVNDGCCKVAKKEELPISELLKSSSLSLFSGLKTGNSDVNPLEFKLPFMEAASSATREERIDVSIWADDVEAASLAATAAAAAFLLSSSVVWKGANDIEDSVKVD